MSRGSSADTDPSAGHDPHSRSVEHHSTLHAPVHWVATQLQHTALMRHIAAPLLRFAPVHGPWPLHWQAGQELELRLALFGLLPLGRQTVRIRAEAPATPGGWPVLRDAGDGSLLRLWDHRITLQALPGGHTLYTDQVRIAARHWPALLTPASAVFARLFYAHRQRRWQRLAQAHSQGAGPLAHERQAAVELLLQAAQNHTRPVAQRWRALEAAHVLGQALWVLHLRVHARMLGLAVQQRDGREAAGQCLRLVLTLPAHLLHRLPVGNIGRSTVPATLAMDPGPEVQALMAAALRAVQPPVVPQPST